MEQRVKLLRTVDESFLLCCSIRHCHASQSTRNVRTSCRCLSEFLHLNLFSISMKKYRKFQTEGFTTIFRREIFLMAILNRPCETARYWSLFEYRPLWSAHETVRGEDKHANGRCSSRKKKNQLQQVTANLPNDIIHNIHNVPQYVTWGSLRRSLGRKVACFKGSIISRRIPFIHQTGKRINTRRPGSVMRSARQQLLAGRQRL